MAESSERQQFVLGPVDDFPPGSHPILSVAGREIGVYNVDGEFYAVQNICPHALAPICRGPIGNTALPSAPGEDFKLGMEGRVLRCVWHGWEFDVVTGEALFGIDKRKLKTFPIAVENGHLVVTMRPVNRRSPRTRLAPESLADQRSAG
jgi:nitrite reductase (NADH) small subunit